MKRILIALILLVCIIPFASASYTMMDDIKTVYAGGTCSGNNSTAISSSYDDDVDTWYENTNCQIRVQFNHNWTADYCHFRYDNIGTVSQSWQTYWSGYPASPNSTTLYRDGGWYSLSPKSGASAYFPVIWQNASQYLAFSPGTTATWRLSEWECFGTSTEVEESMVAEFDADKTDVVGPDYVTFTDNSTGFPESDEWNWSVSPPNGVIVAPGDLDNEDITMLFTLDGNFSITHGVSNGITSDVITKTDYIYVHGSNESATMRVRAVDAISGYAVNGANISVYDIENATWQNRTSATGEVYVTSTTGHTINAYGSALGYDDGESLAVPVVDGDLIPVYMWPSTMAANVSEGNVTLYLTVLEDGTNTRLSGIAVSFSSGAGGAGASYTAGSTNGNGIFQATLKNQTNYNVMINAQKGYLGASKVIYSGTGSGGDDYVEDTMWLQKAYITTAPTGTTIPGVSVTVTSTYLPNCDPSSPDYDAAKCRSSKGSYSLDLLADYMDELVLICILVTMMYLLGFRLGR